MFGHFFVGAPRGWETSAVDGYADFEAFAVIRALFVQQFVNRRGGEVLLVRVVVTKPCNFADANWRRLTRSWALWFLQDVLLDGFKTRVHIKGGHDRFVNGGSQ